MNDEIRNLIFQAIDETIAREDFLRLQDILEQDAEVRQFYLDAINLAESLSEMASDELVHQSVSAEPRIWNSRRRATGVAVVLIAAVMCAVAGAAFWLGRSFVPPSIAKNDASDNASHKDKLIVEPERRIAGHAILRRAVGLRWSDDAVIKLEGQVLNEGPFGFDDGLAEIDFFCGASLILEGPAMVEIESDWSVRVLRGRLRANVPPAARGFLVKAADSEIIDLGTEFVLDVDADEVRVEVVDGEIKLRGGQHDGVHLRTGQGRSLSGNDGEGPGFDGLSTADDLQMRRDDAIAERYRGWRSWSQKRSADSRLIACFPIGLHLDDDGRTALTRAVADVSPRGHHGMIVGPATRTSGRFGARSSGLDFGRAGARVRTMIEGEFGAFTFCCWVRIDNLEHTYNALFMGDGYENGEPHWQIREDGRLMFSVMVDDSQSPVVRSKRDGHPVKDAGLHRVYFTEPFWDLSKSGQWFHLAAVYDPLQRRVRQYVNGDQVSDAEIEDRFYVSKLRIGAAEIGNWGQPFRSTPWFAVRNLNGVIDDLSVYAEALPAEEIKEQYEMGKPVGY